MFDNLPIGILDSGVGGLTVFKEAENKMPHENIIYFGDSKRMPYGNRTADEIILYTNSMIKFLENEGVKIILLACNTISSHIESLNHNVPIMSIVNAGCEYMQAVCKDSQDNNIGLIATKATIESASYEKTLKNLGSDIKIISNKSTKLPKIIDSQIENGPLLDKHIRESIDPILSNNNQINYLLLGCSHFPIIKNEINALYKDIKLLDPAEKMIEIAEKYLKEKNMLASNKNKASRILYTTADTLEFASYIKRLKIHIDKLEKINLNLPN